MTESDLEKPRDWDAELRAIDPAFEGVSPRSTPSSSAGFSPRLVPSLQRLGTWLRVLLGVLVGVGMTQWPYTHGCGWRFLLYLCGIAVVVTAGIWSSLSSWKRRLGVAHVLSQLLIIWGLLLGARALLPRVGYAKTAAPWLCTSARVR